MHYFITWRKVFYMIQNLGAIKDWIYQWFLQTCMAINKIKRQMIKWGKIFAPYKEGVKFSTTWSTLKIELKNKRPKT